MGVSVGRYEIENIPISKKRRKPKFLFDIELAKKTYEMKAANPGVSLNKIVNSLLEQYLSDDQLTDFESHKRRILRRVKLIGHI